MCSHDRTPARGGEGVTGPIEETTRAYARIAADWAARRDEGDPTARARRALATRLAPGALVLDAGCGPGRDTRGFAAAGLRAIGVDRSPEMLAQGRRRHPGQPFPAILGDLTALPLADGSVDAVWCNAALLHLPKATAPRALSEFRRVLCAGGWIALTVKRGRGERWQAEADGTRRFFADYEPDELDALLARNHVAVVEAHDDEAVRDSGDRWLRRLGRSL